MLQLELLAFLFSDSFWFNAVESEVYALAMLFLSVTFWAGLKWEKDFDNIRGDKMVIVNRFFNWTIIWGSFYGYTNNSCYWNDIFL